MEQKLLRAGDGTNPSQRCLAFSKDQKLLQLSWRAIFFALDTHGRALRHLEMFRAPVRAVVPGEYLGVLARGSSGGDPQLQIALSKPWPAYPQSLI